MDMGGALRFWRRDMESILENLGAWLQTLPEVGRGGGVLRYVIPLLAILIVARCAVSLLTFRREAEVWALSLIHI